MIYLAEGFFALFAAIGAVTVMWMIIGACIRPKSCEGVRAYTLVTAKNCDVTRVLRSLFWRQDMLPEEGEVILCGDFDVKTREEAVRMGRRCAKFTVLSLSDLAGYLEKQFGSAGDTDGKGNDTAGGHGGHGHIPQ